MNQEVAKIIDDARKAVVVYGWMRGAAGNKYAGFCTLGALDFAGVGVATSHEMARAKKVVARKIIDLYPRYQTVATTTGNPDEVIWRWNDDDTRGAGDVIDLLAAVLADDEQVRHERERRAMLDALKRQREEERRRKVVEERRRAWASNAVEEAERVVAEEAARVERRRAKGKALVSALVSLVSR